MSGVEREVPGNATGEHVHARCLRYFVAVEVWGGVTGMTYGPEEGLWSPGPDWSRVPCGARPWGSPGVKRSSCDKSATGRAGCDGNEKRHEA